ncbi:hypothetical protein AB1Y20_003687 [Prymnesium parvum]|uniref:Uncharacterized protein n=1 Tax=Prymnesium parvum TaxID=97485 RepID=A0AB34J7J7_PRYPA
MAECFCIDLCARRGEAFLGRTRGVVIHDAASPWSAYFDAVYNGRAPRPFNLSRLTLFYQNTPHWRAAHPTAPSPFRDCEAGSHAHACDERTCAPWYAELLPTPRRMEPVAVLQWPMWPAGFDSEHARASMLVSEEAAEAGHERYRSHEWIEVMRSDSRPYFEEGSFPPECRGVAEARGWRLGEPRFTLAGGTPLPSCFDLAGKTGGGQFPPGCWARPAAGSGIWINTGVSEFPDDDPSRENLDPLYVLLDAAARGVDTCQYDFGDAVPYAPGREVFAPLVVMTHRECIGRSEGIKACVPGGVLRSGWHDLECECEDLETDFPVWRREGEARWREQFEQSSAFPGAIKPELPEWGELPQNARLLNCRPLLSPPPHDPPPPPPPAVPPPVPAPQSPSPASPPPLPLPSPSPPRVTRPVTPSAMPLAQGSPTTRPPWTSLVLEEISARQRLYWGAFGCAYVITSSLLAYWYCCRSWHQSMSLCRERERTPYRTVSILND